MPAPLDVSAVGGWEAIKTLALQLGLKETAERTGLPYDAIKKRSSRENWFAECKPTPKPLPPTMTRRVTNVTSASQALANALAEDSRATRIAGARYARRAMENAAAMDPDEQLEIAGKVKDVIQVAKVVHRWDEDSGRNASQVMVNVHVGSGDIGSIVDVETEVLPVNEGENVNPESDLC